MDRKIKESINQLVDIKRPDSRLEPVPRAAPIAKQRGMASIPAPVVQSGGGGGIAGPLVETDVALRQYHETGLVSSDGLFFLPAIKRVVMEDADNQTVAFEYAAPASLEPDP